jgi:glycosyltransferase involved in cell wall biosynthesis
MSASPHLAMLIPWAVVEGPGGGVARFAGALCEALGSAGVSIELLSLWQHDADAEARLAARLAAAGVPLTCGARWDPLHPYLSFARAQAALAPVLRQRAFALLHAHHEFGDLAAALFRLRGLAPCAVRTVHNEEWRWRPLARALFTDRLYPRVYAAEAGVSQDIVDRLDARPLAHRLGRRAHVLNNAIDLERFARPGLDPAALRQQLGLPADGPLIGSIGRLTEQKGYADFLAAAAIVLRGCPGAYFVLVGEGDLEQDLRRQARELGLADRVLFTGPRPDVERVLWALDLFVSSSLWEGLPTVVLEAMAAGVPVVATAVTGTLETLTTGETGLLVAARDPARLAGAIEVLLARPDFARALAARARQAVERFSIPAVAAAYRRLYEDLLSLSVPGGEAGG